MGVIKSIVSAVKQKVADYRQRHEQAAERRRFAALWAGLTDFQKRQAQRLAEARAREHLNKARHAQHRLALQQVAINAFRRNRPGDRVEYLGAGMFWWPALAPLTQAERAEVRHELRLAVKPIREQKEA